MKKALLVLAVMVVALACFVPAAFATTGVVSENHISWWTPAKSFTAAGKVQAVDTANGRLVVRVTLASVGVAPYLGDDLTIVVTPKTQLLKPHGRLFKAITLSAIRLGDHVRVTGAINLTVPAQPVFTAGRVVATHVLNPLQIKWFAFRGPVKAIDLTGGTIVARPLLVTRGLFDVVGVKTTFVVAPTARIFTWIAGKPVVLKLTDLTVGERVLAQGSIDRSVPAFVVGGGFTCRRRPPTSWAARADLCGCPRCLSRTRSCRPPRPCRSAA